MNENNSHKTHTIIPNFDNKEYKFGASYYIPTDLSASLVDTFYTYFFIHNGTISMTEAIPDITPLYIDLDFTFDGTKLGKQINIESIECIIKYIYKYLSEYFDITGKR